MAKVYKVSLFVTDYNDEYEDGKHLKHELKEHLENLWVGIDHVEVKGSEEFEWDDDLEINKTDAPKEAFEVYFKE